MKIHPAAALFPMMSDDELRELAADIKANGLHEPIVCYVDNADWSAEGALLPDGEPNFRQLGTLVDGRNRLAACDLVGVEPTFAQLATVWAVTRSYDEDVCAFVIAKNVHRRHLEPGQRAMIAAKLATLQRGANQHASQEACSQVKAAEMMGVSRPSVQRARKVLEQGVPELIAAAEAGEIPVKAAAAVAELPKEQQKKILAAGPAAVAVECNTGTPRANLLDRHARGRDPLARNVAHISNRLAVVATVIDELLEKIDGVSLDMTDEELATCEEGIKRSTRANRRLLTAVRAARGNR